MLLEDAVNEFILDCRIRKLSPRTIHNYGVLLNLLIRSLAEEHIAAPDQIRSSHLKSFLLKKEEEGRKPQYLNDLLKTFKVFFKFLVREEYIQHSPAKNIHNVKQPKVLIRTFSEHEIRAFLRYYSDRDFIGCRNKTILAMFFDTGMRLNEVITLKGDQIHDEYILVHGKGNKERLVPVSPFLARQISRYMRVRDSYFSDKVPPEHYVFVSCNGRILTAEAVTKFMKQAAADIHVNPEVRVSPHTCRHTFAHMQLKNGLDLYSLSRIMGHENIAITQRYLDGIRDDEVLEKARQTGVLAHL